MNIFYLSKNPGDCAQMHNDKHTCKMIVEYAQLLSTAHRVLDGKRTIGESKSGRKQQQWELEGDFYKASHVNHPGAIWCRQNKKHYQYLYELFSALCDEYTLRYNKIHLTDLKLRNLLSNVPKNITEGDFIDPPLTMPDEYKTNDAVISYQNLYVGQKSKFSKWTSRTPPTWFSERIENYNESNFT